MVRGVNDWYGSLRTLCLLTFDVAAIIFSAIPTTVCHDVQNSLLSHHNYLHSLIKCDLYLYKTPT